MCFPFLFVYLGSYVSCVSMGASLGFGFPSSVSIRLDLWIDIAKFDFYHEMYYFLHLL